MTRIVLRAAVWVSLALALLFLGDLAVWRLRVAMGGGMGKVMVSRYAVASLKGNKEEYYPDGRAEVDCSRSVFPQAGVGACWWVERHRIMYER